LSLFNELKRRNVFKVAAAYIIVAWLLLQVSDTLVPALHLPEWFHSGVAFLLILGFPVAMIFAWAFEMTPEGIKKEKDIDRSQSITRRTGRKLNFAIIGVLVIAVAYLLLHGGPQPQGPAPDSAFIADKSIAVLPFDNRSADEENAEFFAAGVHDELLTLLSKLGDLRVISRTSVERLDRNLSIPEIGALLGVATVIEGQVQRAGNRLRINVQLIDTAQEGNLWATTYDRELSASNVFEVQSDIARAISKALHSELSSSDETLLQAVPTENTEALNQYLLGRQLQNRNSFESLRQASLYYKKATELDPQYAQAWAATADAHLQMMLIGMIDIQEYITAAGPSIARALELDDQLAEAHAQLAVLHWRSGDLDAAEASFTTAMQLNPHDSSSLEKYGEYLRTTGRPNEAIPILERALEDDPLSVKVLFELGKAEMYTGHPEKNVLYAQRILEIDPSSVSGYVGHLQAYGWQGRYDLLWPWYIKAMTVDPDDWEYWADLGFYSAQLGAHEWADRYLDRAFDLGSDEPATLKSYAQTLALRGKYDEALAIARQALQEGLDDRWGSEKVFLRLVRDKAVRTGDFGEARAWYRSHHPELFATAPVITVSNVNAAADLALLLQHSGEPEMADKLIDAGLAWYQETQIPGVYGYLIGIANIEFLALKGKKSAALDALQSAADVGWGDVWQWDTSSENFASLRNEPRFQAIIAQLEGNMATQLEAIRSLPYMGDFDLRSMQSD
jgi:TolB-like protein/Tfp pilus assembly protein PilF